jgi:hypothetical protein
MRRRWEKSTRYADERVLFRVSLSPAEAIPYGVRALPEVVGWAQENTQPTASYCKTVECFNNYSRMKSEMGQSTG